MVRDKWKLSGIHCSVQVSASADRVVGRGGGSARNDSAENFFQSFLRKAIVSSSDMDRDVHSLTLSV